MHHQKLGVTFIMSILIYMIVGPISYFSDLNAQENPNTITFDNKSEELALVKLIGPTAQSLEVPDSQSRTVSVVTGEYYILIRYGSEPEKYRYAKGEPFTVTQTAMQYSAITITLHKVIGGDYNTHPISKEEFEKAIINGFSEDIVKFKDPIPFYGGYLVGYKKNMEFRGESKLHRPSKPNFMFLTIKLEIKAPFPYYLGRFREILLIDEKENVYQYRGMLEPNRGWLQIDDVEGVEKDKSFLEFSSDEYPFYLDITFEVPIICYEIRLKFKDREQVIFSNK